MKLSEKIKRSISGKERNDVETQEPQSGLMQLQKNVQLSESEKNSLKNLLLDNHESSKDISDDFTFLVGITGEIKSINHQSVLLHGERIRAAKDLFKSYGELAFSRWLKEVYGNRQTPYNFLKYYLFYTSLDKRLQEKMVTMPKQIIYTIASRNCSDEDKERVVDTYDGESKETYLKAIRKAFPTNKSRNRRLKKVTGGQVMGRVDELINLIESLKSSLSLEELRIIDTKIKLLGKTLWE